MIKGTSHLDRYPNSPTLRGKYRGIESYGWTQFASQRVLKVSIQNVAQLEKLGWTYIGIGRSYAYVTKHLSG